MREVRRRDTQNEAGAEGPKRRAVRGRIHPRGQREGRVQVLRFDAQEELELLEAGLRPIVRALEAVLHQDDPRRGHADEARVSRRHPVPAGDGPDGSGDGPAGARPRRPRSSGADALGLRVIRGALRFVDGSTGLDQARQAEEARQAVPGVHRDRPTPPPASRYPARRDVRRAAARDSRRDGRR